MRHKIYKTKRVKWRKREYWKQPTNKKTKKQMRKLKNRSKNKEYKKRQKIYTMLQIQIRMNNQVQNKKKRYIDFAELQQLYPQFFQKLQMITKKYIILFLSLIVSSHYDTLKAVLQLFLLMLTFIYFFLGYSHCFALSSTYIIIYFSYISIILKRNMGQTNMQKIQSSIIDLTQQNQIDRQQAQSFISDYITSGQNIKDVNYFIEHQSLDLYLKHYINAVYPPDEENANQIVCSVRGAQSKSDLKLAIKMIEAGYSDIKDKFDTLIADAKNMYLQQQFQITMVRQKIKEMIISRLEIESYRYYSYKKNSMKQTNSKILYSFDTESKNPILSYARSKSQKNSPHTQVSLQNLTKQIYQDFQTLTFQFEQIDTLFIVIIEVNFDKWKYSKCIDRKILYPLLSHLFQFIMKSLFFVFDSQAKVDLMESRRLFCLFTIVFVEVFLFLEGRRVQRSVQELGIEPKRKKMCNFHKIEQLCQKYKSKLRKWKQYFENQQKLLILDYDHHKQLQFIYINDIQRVELHKMRENITNLNKCVQYLLKQNKRCIKRLTKTIEKAQQNEIIQLEQGIIAKFTINQKCIQSRTLSLIIQLDKVDRIFDIQNDNVFRESYGSKSVAKKTKTSVLNLDQVGWFKMFVKEELENVAADALIIKKIKYPKVNREFRLSNFKHLFSLEQLREELNVNNENINLLEFNNGRLQVFAMKVFSKLPFFKSLPHENDEFPKFLRQVHLNYEKYDNKFHNFRHGVNVMHMCYLLCNCKKNQDILSDFDKFIIVFTGLCHDVGHTGHTNLFQIAKQSQIAVLYNNKSPLQNYHASQTFEILRKIQNNFLSSLSQKQFRYFRELTISSILYTDVKQHFNLMKKFESKKKYIKSDDISLLAGMIVHSSDFGGSVKNFQICRTWSLLVNQEFTNQWKEEGRLGLPQTPFMKDLGNIGVLAKNQTGFLKVIVLPLFKQLGEYSQDKLLIRMSKNIESNIKQWQKLLTEYEKGKKQAEQKI